MNALALVAIWMPSIFPLTVTCAWLKAKLELALMLTPKTPLDVLEYAPERMTAEEASASRPLLQFPLVLLPEIVAAEFARKMPFSLLPWIDESRIVSCAPLEPTTPL